MCGFVRSDNLDFIPDKILGRYMVIQVGPISHANRSLSAVYSIYMGGFTMYLFYLIPLYYEGG